MSLLYNITIPTNLLKLNTEQHQLYLQPLPNEVVYVEYLLEYLLMHHYQLTTLLSKKVQQKKHHSNTSTASRKKTHNNRFLIFKKHASYTCSSIQNHVLIVLLSKHLCTFHVQINLSKVKEQFFSVMPYLLSYFLLS